MATSDTVYVVTPENFPRTCAAMVQITADHGGFNRVEQLDPNRWAVPARWGPKLLEVEAALSGLTEEDFQTFTTGEHTEVMAIAERSTPLTQAGAFLNDFFDGWELPEGEQGGVEQDR